MFDKIFCITHTNRENAALIYTGTPKAQNIINKKGLRQYKARKQTQFLETFF